MFLDTPQWSKVGSLIKPESCVEAFEEDHERMRGTDKIVACEPHQGCQSPLQTDRTVGKRFGGVDMVEVAAEKKVYGTQESWSPYLQVRTGLPCKDPDFPPIHSHREYIGNL